MYVLKGQKDSQPIEPRFYNNVNNGTLLQLYLSLVRPHLKYASPVWNPYKQKHIKHLENVERFALHTATKYWDSGYQDLLSMADITSLESRRSQASLCMLFKIIHDLSQHINRQLLLQQPFVHSNAYQHSFIRNSYTVRVWNLLPESVIYPSSILRVLYNSSGSIFFHFKVILKILVCTTRKRTPVSVLSGC